MKGTYNMKVIIADDEKWVRAAIIRTIPFEKLGLSLVCEASNGLEALEFCKEYQPDILITDIKMPGLTGLELIKEIHGFSSKIKIIILSGYSDFEYAKTAMNYGITDYILKPVDQKEISEVLLKIKESILIERKQYEENNLFKSQYEKTLAVLKDKFLNQLILPNYLTLESIKSELKRYNLSFINPFFSINFAMASDTRYFFSRSNCSFNIIFSTFFKTIGYITVIQTIF
jgi:two-component system response regulator YesN